MINNLDFKQSIKNESAQEMALIHKIHATNLDSNNVYNIIELIERLNVIIEIKNNKAFINVKKELKNFLILFSLTQENKKSEEILKFSLQERPHSIHIYEILETLIEESVFYTPEFDIFKQELLKTKTEKEAILFDLKYNFLIQRFHQEIIF